MVTHPVALGRLAAILIVCAQLVDRFGSDRPVMRQQLLQPAQHVVIIIIA